MNKGLKKLIALGLLWLFIISTTYTVPVSASSFYNATGYTLGTTQSGILTLTEECSCYSFELSSSGKIDLSFDGYMKWTYLNLIDSSGQQIWSANPKWNSTIEMINYDESIYLTGGTYYFQVKRYDNYTGNYNFTISFSSANESFSENKDGNNNSLKLSNEINLDNKYLGQLAVNDSKDFYNFTLTTSGQINLSFSAGMKCAYIKIFDSNGEQIWDRITRWNDTTQKISFNEAVELTSGTYYFCVELYDSYYGNYDFTLPYTFASESFIEGNGRTDNSLVEANVIECDSVYQGQLAINDEKDFYKFSVTKNVSVTFNLAANMDRIYSCIYDSNGNEIKHYYSRWNTTSQMISISEMISLSEGTYFICFQRDWSSVGDYSFSIDQPLGKIAIKSLDTSSKTITVKWKKLSSCTGYEIQCSTNKSFTTGKGSVINDKNTVSYDVKKLIKNKTYYVRMRAFKNVNGTHYYGEWSSTRAIKCK